MNLMRTLASSLLALAPAFALADFSTTEWQSRAIKEQGINALGQLYLELSLEENPVAGIYYGVHGKDNDVDYYDRRLPDTNSETGAAFDTARQAMLLKLNTIDHSKLSRPDRSRFGVD